MKVLLVDDESLARQRAARLLAGLSDIEVVASAANAEQALFEYQPCPPDVLLLDISMPGMNGIELAWYLATFQPGLAIVFCNAYDEYAIAVFESHAVGYLLKPIQRDKLAALFSRLARLSQLQLAALACINETTQRQQLCATSAQGVSLLPGTAVLYFYASCTRIVS
jgi:two-component system response regulator AlgR